jgi:hypothetical protein
MAMDEIFLFISIFKAFKGKPFICSLLRLYNFMMTSRNLCRHVIRANSAQPPQKIMCPYDYVIYNIGDSETHINANVVARPPSRFEVWDWFSVEIRPNLPVPILVENEHLQIWQLLTASLVFFLVKTQPFTHCFYFEWAEKTPQHFNASLFVTIWVAVIDFFDNWRANAACYEKGRFTKYRALLAGPLFLPWAGLHAG